jgi:hypothetical protein
MEGIIKSVQAWDKNCIGCKKFKSDIMLSFQIEGSEVIHDIFLTTEQAEYLIARLEKRLEENKF